MDGDKIITLHPQGRFKAGNGTAAAALAGLGFAWLPDGIIHESGQVRRLSTQISRFAL